MSTVTAFHIINVTHESKVYLYMFALQISLQQQIMKTVSATRKERTQLTQYLLFEFFGISIHGLTHEYNS
jgi:hypothetical protein